MNIYISGPITGQSRLKCLVMFNAAAKQIIRRGHTPINPFDIGSQLPVDLEHRDYLLIDLMIIRRAADAVLFLDGWEASKGCKTERKYCERHNIPILDGFEDIPKHYVSSYNGPRRRQLPGG